MDNSRLDDLRSDFAELKRTQINLENILRGDREKKSNQELETCLQELKKFKETLNQNKDSLDEKNNPCEPCKEEIGKLKEDLSALKKLIADTKQEEVILEKEDKENGSCQDKAIFNEIKTALQEKCKRLYKEELEKLKKPKEGGNDNAGNGKDKDKEGTTYQEAILTLLNKLLEKKKKEDEDNRNGENKENNKGDNNKDNDKSSREGVKEDGKESCLKRLEEFKKAIKDIDTSNDKVDLKLQNLKRLFTKFDKETEVPPPDQNSQVYF